MSVNEWIGVISFASGILGFLWRLGLKLNNTLSDLINQVGRLNDNLTEGKLDRQLLHSKLDQTDGRLDDHQTRITVLEKFREEKQYEKH